MGDWSPGFGTKNIWGECFHHSWRSMKNSSSPSLATLYGLPLHSQTLSSIYNKEYEIYQPVCSLTRLFGLSKNSEHQDPKRPEKGPLLEKLKKKCNVTQREDTPLYCLPFRSISADQIFHLGKVMQGEECLDILFLGLTGSGKFSFHIMSLIIMEMKIEWHVSFFYCRKVNVAGSHV